MDILKSFRVCSLIASCDSSVAHVLNTIASQGWTGPHPYAPPSEILKVAYATDTIVYCPYGSFDDKDKGCAVIAKEPLINKIVHPQKEAGRCPDSC